MSNSVAPVFILDEIVVKPGMAPAYRDAYEQRYVPTAQQRGMQRVGSWRNPPLQDFDELPTTFYFLWSVTDVQGWWRMRMSRNADGSDQRFEKHRWWQESDRMTLSRKRTVLSSLETSPLAATGPAPFTASAARED